jgi:hypothetical protein
VDAADRLRQDDAVRRRRHDAVEVGVGQARHEPVDAHEQARPFRPAPRRPQEVRGDLTGRLLPGRRHRILEVGDDGVGARLHGFLELAGAVAGHEQVGAQHQALPRFFMKACRRHSATSVPSWL